MVANTSRLIAPPSELKPGSIVDAYLRDSGGEKQDRSVASQLIEVQDYCTFHNLQLRHIYKDVARSGKSTVGREDFTRLITDIESERDNPDAVIIWDYARFARNTREAVLNIAKIENQGVLIHSLTDDIPEGEYRDLIRMVKHMGNEAERKKNARAVKRELRQLVRQYGAMFGFPQSGFKREPLPPVLNERTGEMRQLHRWVWDDEKVYLVQRAWSMRAKGEAIPRIMQATGLYDKVSSFTRFFKNRLYLGELHWGDVTILNYCPPMIDQETWDEVQRVNQRRSRPQLNIDNPRRIVSPFILSGLLHCQECGAPMSAYSIRKWDYYVCSRRKSKHNCDARRIPREPIESEVVRLLTEELLTLENLLKFQAQIKHAWAERSHTNDKARRELEKQLHSLQNKIRNITNAIAEHGSSRSLLTQLTGLEAQETELRADLARLEHTKAPIEYTPPQMAEIAETLKAELADENTNRASLRGLVVRVIARRTDTHITGVIYCNKGIGSVPPRGAIPITLFETDTILYPIKLPIRKHKAPIPTK